MVLLARIDRNARRWLPSFADDGRVTEMVVVAASLPESESTYPAATRRSPLD